MRAVDTLSAMYATSCVEKIGSGTYADVYKIQCDANTIVAKYSKHTIFQDTSTALEWVISSRFTHPNFIKITECRRIGDRLVLIMPYIGYSLANHILNNTLAYDDSWPAQIREMATVLKLYNIVHKDISLHNILVSQTDNSKLVLCDYGLANHNNPYDCGLHTSLPIIVQSLASMDAECAEFIITQLAVYAKKNRSTCRQLPRRITADDTAANGAHTHSYMWSFYNIAAIAAITGYSADFVATFLGYTLSDKHVDDKCFAIIDAIINNPVAVYDNTARIFT
jgi:serine/threonine protein kinase